MKFIAKLIFAATIIVGILNGLVFIATVIELLTGWVGTLGYILWVIAAPIMSPAAIALPWFEAWVSGNEVNERLVILWASFFVCIALRALTWKWAPDRD